MADINPRSAAMELSHLLAEFLIRSEVTNSYTLDEFREAFPQRHRGHKEVKLLYKAFQMKRMKLRQAVRRNVSLHCVQRSTAVAQITCSNENTPQRKNSEKDQEQIYLEKKLILLNKDTREAEKQFLRCATLFKEKEFLTHGSAK
ncbi:hypothetical protein AC249_AIPGENE4028 [Exaiptasia diaphana]|nr:hypothetical protein AC249_AIPGENE4028 [Exaiptasia diaphana]